MPATVGPEEILQVNIAAMGQPLGEVYTRLWNEVASLHDRWSTFCALFVDSRDVVDLLNASAQSFFGDVSAILAEHLTLHVSRLLDPAEQLRYQNLSLAQLVTRIDRAALRDQISTMLGGLQTDAKSIRMQRDKRLAHKDLQVAVNGGLPSVTVAALRRAVRGAREIMNAVELEYLGSITQYGHGISGPGDAESLLVYLKKGKEAFDAERAAAMRGVASPRRENAC